MQTALRPGVTRALLLLLALALYGSSLTFDFIDYDDPRILLGHPHLFGPPGGFWEGLRNIFVALPREEPLLVRDLTWLVETQVFGFGLPFGHHLGNVVINALNSVLFYEVVRRLSGRPITAALAAFLFTIAPVHVEPVCWVMGRKDLLVSFFMLLALLTSANALTCSHRRSWLAYAASIGAVALAMLSKINAITLIGILILHRFLAPHIAGDRRPPVISEGLRRVTPLVPHAVVSLAIFVWYREQLAAFGMFGRGPGLFDGHAAVLIRNLPQVIHRYVQLMIVPGEFSLLYDRPAVGVPAALDTQILGTLWLVLFLVALVGTARRRADLFFWLAAAGCLAVPYLNLVYIGIWVGVRYVYLIVGFLLVAAVLIAEDQWAFGGFRQRAVAGIGTVFAAYCLVQVAWVLPAWRNTESLWRYEVARADPPLLALQGLARVYVKEAEKAAEPAQRQSLVERSLALIERGLAQYRRLDVEPVEGYLDYQVLYASKLHHWRGRVAELQGDSPRDALPHYLRAHTLEPKSRLHNYTLAKSYFQMATTTIGASRAEWATRSLEHFRQYGMTRLSEHGGRDQLRTDLQRTYVSQFPELAPAIAEVRAALNL